MVKSKFSKKTFFDLDLKWIDDIKINLSAVERRTTSLTKRRTVKKEYQVAWLLKSITLLDLTTLSGDDTFGKIDRLCQKALQPISLTILESLDLKDEKILVGAVCVYHNLVSHAKKKLYGKLPVAAVSTGFPAGLSSFETRKKEITNSIKAGANEIDIVINRAYVLQNDWQRLYDEVRAFKEIAKEKKIKVILGVGDLETLRNVAKASLICMMAGADFIKTSTGKISPAATMPVTYVMLEAIKDYYKETGIKIGMKPAGGISTAKQSLQYLVMLKEILGDEWMTKEMFRFGASRLANDILMQLQKQESGIYQSLDYFSKD